MTQPLGPDLDAVQKRHGSAQYWREHDCQARLQPAEVIWLSAADVPALIAEIQRLQELLWIMVKTDE